MKLTKSKLKQLIKEELKRILSEGDVIKGPQSWYDEEELTAIAYYKKHENEIDAVIDSIEHRDKDYINTLVRYLHNDAYPGA